MGQLSIGATAAAAAIAPDRLAGHRRGASAFTLIELLIVIVILGILAAIVIPQFSSASQSTRENTLKDQLRYLRTQLQVFRAQHRDVAPGYPNGNTTLTPTEADFAAQMTRFTNELCATNMTFSTTYKYGPYAPRIPANPLSGLSTVLIVNNNASIPAADGSTGWIYKPQTQEIYANSVGQYATW